MTVRIGSNLDALKGQRSLGQASDRIEKVYQRLSTGQRINRASDDAAGLSIADALTAKSRVFTRGAQNVSDGLSALTIADSAVETLIQLTTRIQELAEQGANGSYSNRQRAALDKEAQSLRDEFLRIVQSTAFNGQRLLDGTVQGLQIQAGYGADGAIASSVGGKLGTGQFNNMPSIGVGSFPTSIATADFNGDGFQDVVTGNYFSDNVSVLLGSGNGTFYGPADYAVGLGPAAIAVADFNHDGHFDIVTANGNSADVSVLLGSGTGTFSASSSIAVGQVPSALTTADFNGDGNIDIATTSYDEGTVSVLLGQGRGSFSPQQALFAGGGSGLSSIVTGDFNGDGRADIVTANPDDGEMSIFLGSSNGTFVPRAMFGGGDKPSSLVAADFNRDGNLDLAMSQSGTGGIGVSLGVGDGTFSATTLVGTSFLATNLALSDVNGDGNIDIAASSNSGFAVLLGRGSGTFSDPGLVSVLDNQAAIICEDINNDGVPDILGTNIGKSSISILVGQARDGIQPLLPISLQTQADSKEALSIVSKKLELLSAQRGIIGAAQSRLLSGSRTLLSQRDEFLAANSRIRDTDFAGEAAELTRTQIVQNAATAVMAQANQQPALALKLLRP